ncbi:MAG: N utilization substance protein B, partial [Verrucomicrobiales bacterium]|nr:N utilization substance protein B [Verrucomicrobiales bacterium]
MRHRRLARERAVQFLFQYDLNPPGNPDEAIDKFWASQTTAAIDEEKNPASWGESKELPPPTTEDNAVRLFGEKLIRGVLDQMEELDNI